MDHTPRPPQRSADISSCRLEHSFDAIRELSYILRSRVRGSRSLLHGQRL
jgi:hypothetical protein